MSSRPWELCASLTDTNAKHLLLKINKYLQHETGAGIAFSIFLLHSSKEAIVHAVGSQFLENPLRLPMNAALINSASGKDCAYSTDISIFDPEIMDLIAKENVDVRDEACLFPVKNSEGELCAIAVLINLPDEKIGKDEAARVVDDLFRYCLTLIVNTIRGEEEERLKKQCQHLLLVARKFFSHLDNLDVLLRGIMSEARRLTSAQRCSLFLIDREQGDLVAKVFDNGDEVPIKSDSPTEVRIKRGQGIAGHVVETGRLININNAYSHPLFYKGLDEMTGFVTKNILCFPIRDENEIIGVAQLCNKIGGRHFDACDEEVASAFSIYCGISIMHSIVYKKMADAQARTKISIEMLIYHLKISNHDVNKVLNCKNEHQFQEFQLLHFKCRSLSVTETPCYVIQMFESLNFLKRFEIRGDTLARFTLYVQKGYRDVPYHNWMHAFSVAHFAYAAIKTFDLLANEYLTDLECLVYIVSCLCHDIDHRGTNNSYEIREGSLLASLYSSEGSIMEHHHLAHAMCILNTEDCNILQGLPSSQYDTCLQLLRDCIIATDLSNHFKHMDEYKKMISDGYCKENSVHRKNLLTLLMTCADLCDQIKDWACAKIVADAVYTEFFHQGDIEKQQGLSPQEMMDRETAVIPDLQINFLENIVLPVFRLLEQLFPAASTCVQVIENHIKLWHEETIVNKN